MNWLSRWSEAIKESQVQKMYIRACKLFYKSEDSLIQVCTLVDDLLTRSLITQVLRIHIFSKSIVPKSLSQWYLERYRSVYSLLASCHLMLIVYQYNGLQPMLLDLSLANKKTLIITNEPAICDMNTGQRIFWCNSCHFKISIWMSAITTMHWRSYTIALEAYFI